MSISAYAIVFDCGDALKLAQFWSAVLDRPVGAEPSAEFASIGDGGISFYQVPEPKTVKNRVHLDLSAADLDGEVERITSLGAREVARFDEDGARWVTLTDPEGNEFDVVAA